MIFCIVGKNCQYVRTHAGQPGDIEAQVLGLVSLSHTLSKQKGLFLLVLAMGVVLVALPCLAQCQELKVYTMSFAKHRLFWSVFFCFVSLYIEYILQVKTKVDQNRPK